MLEEGRTEELPIDMILKRKNGSTGDHLGNTAFVQPNPVDSDRIPRKHPKRLYSWPPMPDDASRAVQKDMVRVRVLESTSALSLGTFATLLVEVAVRLDYLLEAVVELGELAHFKDPQQHGHPNAVIVH
jgi:hypothetical protein